MAFDASLNPDNADNAIAAEEHHRQSNRQWWQLFWQAVGAIATVLAFGAAFVYAYFAHQQVSETQSLVEQARKQSTLTNEIFQATEQPYVALGDRDGRVGEFIFLGQDIPVGLKLYFFNSGREPATDVTINLFAFGTGVSQFTPQHIERFKMVKPSGEVMSYGGFGSQGITIPGESVYTLYQGGKWIPDPTTFQSIDRSTAKRSFEPQGTIEYCDRFGRYHCVGFGARYAGNPIRTFVVGIASTELCPLGQMSDTPDPEVVHQPNGEIDRQVAIPRCPQPDERLHYRHPRK